MVAFSFVISFKLLNVKDFCPTIIVRHRKERLKKCSLRGLEKRKDLIFYTYPVIQTLPIKGYVLLTVGTSEVLSLKDHDRGLLLLDGTWRLADRMEKALKLSNLVVRRTLPAELQTAYPRRQTEENGLASIEALYVAYVLTGRNPEGLLDYYRYKELFLEKNAHITL